MKNFILGLCIRNIPIFSKSLFNGRSTENKNFSDQSDSQKSQSKKPDPNIVKKTPKGRLDENVVEERHRDAEKEPLPRWPKGENPHTGEKGGPAGPEPTRFGDWERKGRVSDF